MKMATWVWRGVVPALCAARSRIHARSGAEGRRGRMPRDVCQRGFALPRSAGSRVSFRRPTARSPLAQFPGEGLPGPDGDVERYRVAAVVCQNTGGLKGIMDPNDADIAVQAGVSGIFVSNHGARNLDTAPATIDALPLVSERVGGRIPARYRCAEGAGIGSERGGNWPAVSSRPCCGRFGRCDARGGDFADGVRTRHDAHRPADNCEY